MNKQTKKIILELQLTNWKLKNMLDTEKRHFKAANYLLTQCENNSQSAIEQMAVMARKIEDLENGRK